MRERDRERQSEIIKIAESVLTLKYFIANEGVCSVSTISKIGSSDRDRASCRDLSGESDSGGMVSVSVRRQW